jgi:glutathione synthase/RimK-type ligase-like ATP-grasp enzyme
VRVVVLSADPADGNAALWLEHLTAAGADTAVLHGCPAELPPADLVVSHVLLTGRPTPHPVWDAALGYEAAGTPLTNATACLAVCADKWRTHEAWRRAGLPQPRTWRLGDLNDWPDGRVLVKPAFGESARGIAVVRDRADALGAAGDWAPTALVQEVIECRSVLRVHATPERLLGACARPAAAIAGLAPPDPAERPVTMTDALATLSVEAVRAVGGGIVGLDLIEIAGGHVLLEANPTFSVPAHLPDYLPVVVRAVLDRATAAQPQPPR